MVKIENGVNTLSLEGLEGRTVSSVRERVAQTLNVDPAAVPHVNGVSATASYVLKDGDTLEFIKASGTKGC